MAENDLMSAAQRGRYVSDATIAALEQQIQLSKSHSPSACTPPYARYYEAHDSSRPQPDLNLEIAASEEEEEDCHAGLVPRSPCDTRRTRLALATPACRSGTTSPVLNSSDCNTPDSQEAPDADPALASLVEALGDSAAHLQSRQRAAHTLARDLAGAPPAYSAHQLTVCCPVAPLLALADHDESSLTAQLVLSCITNLATISSSLVAAESGPAVAGLLLRALRGGEVDAALRSYALTAANNLAHEEAVMAPLERAGASPIVRGLATHCFPGGDEAKHVALLMRALKRHTPKRPSSAATVLSRVGSFSRGASRGRAE